MQKKDNIEQFFKEKEQQLSQNPPSRAWDTLASRLDAEKQSNRVGFYRRIAVAAAFVALIASTALFTLVQNENAHTSEAAMDNTALAFVTLGEDTDHNLSTIVAYHKYHAKSYAISFEEGDVSESLIVNTKARSSRQPKEEPAYTNEDIADNDKTLAEPIISATDDKTDEPNNPIAAKEETTASSEYMADTEVAVVEFQESPTLAEAVVEEMEMLEPSARAETALDVDDYQLPPSVPTRAKVSASEAASNINAGFANTQSIEKFKWLLGKWEGHVTYNKYTIETWEQTDEFTLVGNGFLIAEGDTTLIEEMKIALEGDNLNLWVALSDKGSPTKYQLTSQSETSAIFENNTIDFPRKIIFQKESASNFSTIMKNEAEDTPVNFGNDFMKQRNNIAKEEMIRTLEKQD